MKHTKALKDELQDDFLANCKGSDDVKAMISQAILKLDREINEMEELIYTGGAVINLGKKVRGDDFDEE